MAGHPSPAAAPSTGAAFSIVTLGCPKNEADSDALTVALERAGHAATTPDVAEVIVVNTCGFIDAAKEESIDALLDLAAVAASTGARLVARGCLVARHRAELRAELPEVDLFTSFDDRALLTLLDDVAASMPVGGRRRPAPGRRRRRPVHRYVKISDGCDHHCAFCAIPLIKGSYDVVAPAKVLATTERALEGGAREIVLVGQDTSRWHHHGYGGLPRLLGDLKAAGAPWVRLEYLQPEGIDDELLEAVAEHAVPYLDVPLQHADAGVLRRMRRGGGATTYAALLTRIRRRIPGVAVRSTFLVGHPGETEAAFDELVAFVRDAGLAVAGVFVFDPQEGTAAASQIDRPPLEVAQQRAALLADEIEQAAAEYWQALVGGRRELLVERGTRRPEAESIGRIPEQAPDVDGLTFVRGRCDRRGGLTQVRLTGVTGYDLHAVAVPDRHRRIR